MTDIKNNIHILRRVNIYLAFILVLAGLVIAVVTLYNKPTDMTQLSDVGRLIYNFFELLGFTLFSSGIFSFFLQLPDWKNYFEERLKNIVLEQEYLNSLDSDSLSNLQIKTLKAYFKASDIDKEGSFLNYFQENLSQYIKEPYRDDVRAEMILLDEDTMGIWVSDRVIYNCRMVGNKIQEHIKWKPEPDEFLEIESVEIRVKKKNSAFKTVLKMVNQNNVYIVNDSGEQLTLDKIYQKGLIYPLHDYNEDGLIVELKSKYKITKEKFSTWVMAHPTKNFYLTIRYPEQWKIRFESLLLHPDKVIIDREKGFFSMQYNEWLLPNSGVVYSFITE